MTASRWRSQLIVHEARAHELRQDWIAPQARIRGIFMTTVLERLSQAIGPMAAQELARRIIRVDPPYYNLKLYDLAEFLAFRHAAAKAMATRQGSLEQAMLRLGAASAKSFLSSAAGTYLRARARNNVHRLLEAVPQGHALTVAAGARRTYYERTGARSGVFTFENDLLGPLHHLGVFTSSIADLCDFEAEIELEQHTLLDWHFRLTW